MNYYEILQVSPTASNEVLTAAFRSLAKKYHPDGGTEISSEEFCKVKEAYDILSDPQKRKEYDESITEAVNSVKTSTTSIEHASSASSVADIIDDLDEKSPLLVRIIETILGLAFWGFVIWCLFIGNGEKLKMNILNRFGEQEYATEGTLHDVFIYTNYEDKLLSNDRDVWLNIDGERVTLLSSGKENVYNAQLPEGNHIIFLETKFWHINSDKLNFEVKNDDLLLVYNIEKTTFGASLTTGF